MSATYGIKRVLEPKNVLPTSAWKLDNGRNIFPDELRVSIKRIHLEGTGFKQICTESNDDEKKIKQNIIDMVIRRGKLHNPVTDTGGLVMGVVEEIGAEYDNRENLKTGDLIICNASAAVSYTHLDVYKRQDLKPSLRRSDIEPWLPDLWELPYFQAVQSMLSSPLGGLRSPLWKSKRL